MRAKTPLDNGVVPPGGWRAHSAREIGARDDAGRRSTNEFQSLKPSHPSAGHLPSTLITTSRNRVFTGVIHAIKGPLVLSVLGIRQSIGTEIPEGGGAAVTALLSDAAHQPIAQDRRDVLRIEPMPQSAWVRSPHAQRP
jgi:hypothetical protein